MSDVKHEINLALRTAAGHERAANSALTTGEKQYEMKMISAGACVYSAFALAIKAAPEYQGRKIDDAAIRRIYGSTKRRPWWDEHLTAVKVEGKPVDREWGKRLIQWHIDPEAAKARRAKHTLRLANTRKAQAKAPVRGARAPQAAAPSMQEMRAVHAAAQTTALAGRGIPQAEDSVGVSREDLLGEVNRISSAVRKVGTDDLGTVLEILRVTAREVERYVP